MQANDLTAYLIPLRDDVRVLSDAGYVTQALKLIDFLVSEGKVDDLQRERLLLEAHRLPVFLRDYPLDEERALELANAAGFSLDAGSLSRLRCEGVVPWALVDGKVHLHRRFLDTLDKGRETPERQADLQLRDLVMKKMTGFGHAEARITVHVGLKVKESAWVRGQVLEADLPIPVASPFMEELDIHAQSGQLVGMSPVRGRRRVAHFRGIPKADEEFWIEYSFINRQKFRDLAALESKCEAKVQHSREEAPYLVATPYLRALCKEIIGDETNPIRKARLIYQWVIHHVSYAYMPSYQTISNLAEYGAVNGRGDCGIQASLFINLARIAGLKSDWMAGMYVTPHRVGNHDWATFQVPGLDETFYADCSFGGGALRKGNLLGSGFYFGNLDVMRVPCTTILAPGPSLIAGPWRNDPTDNQSGEAWYGNRTLAPDELVDTRRTVSFKLL